ncbi:hypothetical protein ACIBF5_06675 [Micromonospora sp. NPDC050417]|uniref:hypothetical protein n=1 Tax=Micromonospora sp. NPDC050417 TaxID=3364280 RepID=UPI0037B8456B
MRRLLARWSRDTARAVVNVFRRLIGLPAAPLLVDEIRCPRCRCWVAPRRFDLIHMACRTCRATLARPGRGGDLLW